MKTQADPAAKAQAAPAPKTRPPAAKSQADPATKSRAVPATKTQIIGFAGSGPGSGKDEAAKCAAAFWGAARPGVRVQFRRFADALREHLDTIHGISPAVSSTRAGKALVLPNGNTVGRELQVLGAGMRKKCGADVWVRPAMAGIPARGHLVVFCDVRYPNEVAALRGAGGSVVWVARPGAATPAHLAGRDPLHESERLGPGSADVVIKNDGSLEEYRRRLRAVFEKLAAGGAP